MRSLTWITLNLLTQSNQLINWSFLFLLPDQCEHPYKWCCRLPPSRSSSSCFLLLFCSDCSDCFYQDLLPPLPLGGGDGGQIKAPITDSWEILPVGHLWAIKVVNRCKWRKYSQAWLLYDRVKCLMFSFLGHQVYRQCRYRRCRIVDIKKSESQTDIDVPSTNFRCQKIVSSLWF